MKLLILGGTRFVGRHLVEAALANGHEVTLFYRGKTNPDLFPEAEHIHGDRDSQMHLLDGRTWDACIDTCGYVPRHVRQSAGRLADAVEQYTFISTISVYDEPVAPDADETAALKTLEDEDTEEVTGETYGGLKVLCERAAEDAMPGRVLHVRPGLIVGPFDPTDRFTYWLERVAHGGEVLVPAAPDRRIQFIDGRDLAAWTLQMVEANNTGIYNAVGPGEPLTWSAWLDAIQRVTGSDAQFTYVSDAFMEASGAALPMFVPEPYSHMLALSNAKAAAEGLTHRPLETIIRDTLAWNATRPADEPRRVGMSAEQEKDLLQKWSQQPTT
jgi:2'-hydroxyisoflavone reductase